MGGAGLFLIVVVLAYGLCAGTWALARRTVNFLLSQED
jgi:hypothetical protein